MYTNVFSSLSRGCGTWTGSFDHKLEANDKNLTYIDPDVWYHRHGVTVRPRASTTPVKMSGANDRHMGIPKTFLTRKGALMLFSTSDDMTQESEKFHRLWQKRYNNCNLKLTNFEKLSLSVLQYDHKEYEKKAATISDKDNHFVLDFLYELDKENCFYDVHSQPGRDVQYYLQDLKNKARIYRRFDSRARSSELQGIRQHQQQALPKFKGLHKESTQANVLTNGKDTLYTGLSKLNINTVRTSSRNEVLSSKKLTTSHMPLKYVDQQVSVDDDRLVWQQLNYDTLESCSYDKCVPYLPRTWCYQNSFKEEKPHTPVNSKKSGHQDNLLSAETCREEKDTDFPSDVLSDDYEETEVDSPWSEGKQFEVSFRSRFLVTSASEGSEIGKRNDGRNVGIIHPLHPPYSALMIEDYDLMPHTSEEMAYKPTVYQDEESSSKGSTAKSMVISRIATSEGLVYPSQHDIVQVRSMSDEDRDATLSSADRKTIEIDTSMFLLKDDQVFTPFKIDERGEVTDCLALETSSTPIRTEKTLPRKSLVEDQNSKKESERTTQSHKESIHEQEISSIGEEVEVSTNAEENRKEVIKPELSNKAQKENEEKKMKAAKLKEEKHIAETKKIEEEERKRQQIEEKRKAAEKRLKRLTNEVAVKKKEQNRKQEEEAASGKINQTLVKPTPPSAKRGNTSCRKAKGTGGKPVNKKGKLPLVATENNFARVIGLTSENGVEKEVVIHQAVVKLNETTAVPVNMANNFKVSAPLSKKLPHKKKALVSEHLKDIFSRKRDSQTREELEAEIGKRMSAMDKALHEGTLHTEESEGLSADDFILAQETLMERIKKAEEQIQEDAPKLESKKVVPQKARLDKKAMKKQKGIEARKKQDLARKLQAIKEQQGLEKQRRLEEVRDLQDKIALNEEAQKTKETDEKKKAEELAERIESIRLEEEQIARAEADARAQVAIVRREQRETRDTLRKIDLERKKQSAIEKREKEKIMNEAAKQEELDMLDQIADLEMVRRLREEQQAKRDDEELAAEERFEAEMRAAENAADEEEERFRDLERQAEEEAFQQIIEEKEAAEKQRWALEKQAKIMRKEERKAMNELIEREMKLKEEMRQCEEEEERQNEAKRERLRELQRIGDEARERMQTVLEQRRAWALYRRVYNLNARSNLDAIKQSQGFTDPWIFTYFVHWPKRSYMRLMGKDPKKKKSGILLRTKSTTSDANLHAGANLMAQSSTDVTAVEG